MEIFRALAVFAEPPRAELAAVAEALELGEVPGEEEYTELFLLQLYPYASVYLGAEGMLGGEARDRIAGFWRVIGLEPPQEPDHLALMLALYAQFSESETAAHDPREREAWRHARETFLWEHLLSWVLLYLDELDRIAGSSFYSRWSSVLRDALCRDARRLRGGFQLPTHFVDVPTVCDPRNEGTEAFLNSLLAPVRSGFIITRRDLALLARNSNVGARIGERKFMLRAMLEQDARETLSGLSGLAAGWADQQLQYREMMGPIAEFRQGRAQNSARLLLSLSAGTD
jgi:TorA maturation chaperone TorD